MSKPTDSMILDPLRGDPPVQSRALTAICLEHESTMPTKFMVGTEQGCVVACNRRARKRKDRLSYFQFFEIFFIKQNYINKPSFT